MTDVQDRDRQRFMQGFKVRQYLFLGSVVEPRERLVHQKQPRLRQQCAPHRDALALASGKRGRPPPQQRGNSQEIDDIGEPQDRLRTRPASATGTVEQVLANR
jgi:hypothetical protein